MKFSLWSLLLLCLSFQVIALANYAIAMPGHPRLLALQKDIPGIKERLNHPDFVVLREAYEKQKHFKTNGVSADGEPDEDIRQKAEALAFSYLTDNKKNKQDGLDAIALMNKYLPSISKTKGYHQNTSAYEAAFTAALVYDWCYNLMDAATKTTLAANMKNVSCLAEYCIFKNTPKQYLSGHYGEYAPTVFLALGIALYDEDKDIFDFAYKEQLQSFAPSRNPWYASGAHHQGSQYLHVRFGNEVLQAFILDKLGLNPYSKDMGNVAFRDMYDNIPQAKDMDGMPEGDCHNNITMGDNYLEFMPLAASLSKNPFLQSYAKLNLNKLDNLCARAFIFYNPSLPAAPFDSLKLSRYFPSPSGLMIARTKWDLDKKSYSSNSMVVFMNMKEYYAKNHTHLDIGHFGIYYKGHLALDAGIYQGKDADNEWGKLNYVNYYARTVAHNSILILDPNEPTPYEGSNKKAVSRDGGQFSFKNRAWDSTQEMLSAGKSATIMAEDMADGLAPDYSYLKGDMTRAYNIPPNVAVYPAKADTVRRSFVFLNLKDEKIPGALIVLDKVVSTNASFKKTWLLHSQNEPSIRSGNISFENTNEGRNGKLVDAVLLPEINNQSIEKMGGEGKEYWVDGKNWGTVTQEDAGRWRTELSPKTAAASTNFLNVIQVMDANLSPNPLVVTKAFATKGNYVAVTIGNRIVAQQLTLDHHASDIQFTIGEANKEYAVLITDLKAGNWTIVSPAGKTSKVVTESAGTVYFKSKGGMFLLKKN